MKEIIISRDIHETRVAITDNGRLDEYHVERSNDQRMVGSIYKGRITSIVPGIGAAFVDIGLAKNGFLYVSDIIEPKPEEDAILEGSNESTHSAKGKNHRKSRIEDVVKQNQEILVQVVKEPFGTKGARLTTHLSLPGRYMVLMCNDARLGISKRITEAQERARLREILTKLRFSKEAGLIVRTAGVDKQEQELARDVKYLSKIYSRVKRTWNKAKAPSCIYQEYALAQRVIRDSFSSDVRKIVVDSKDEFHNLRRFLQTLIPKVKVRLDHYKGDEPLFESVGVDEHIEKMFDKRVDLPSGGSIIVEPTEGLVAIDVNTAKYRGKRSLEETAFQVDKEAAIEVARQLRLRDVGGIVVIDFIDLDVPAHRRELVKVLEKSLESDRAKTNLVSFSEICVAELTRQRMRRTVETVSSQPCPYCSGKGTVKSEITMAISAIRQAKHALHDTTKATLELTVHPQVALRLLQEDRKSLTSLESRTRSKVLVLSDPSIHFEEVSINMTKGDK